MPHDAYRYRTTSQTPVQHIERLRPGISRRIKYAAQPRLIVSDGLSVLSTRVVLATAYRDHYPTPGLAKNLKALCQRCHLIHDRPEHQRRRKMTLRSRKAIGDLFAGPYT